MLQKRKDLLNHREKFEDGVLRVDACTERHYSSRDSQYRTKRENLSIYSFGSSALREESRLMRAVYYLKSLGFSPDGDESLEEFVSRYSEYLNEEVF